MNRFHDEEEDVVTQNPAHPYHFDPTPVQYNSYSPYQNINYDIQNNQYPNIYNPDFSSSTKTSSQVPHRTTKFTFRPFNLFTVTTTKSPYDFKNFGKSSTTLTSSSTNNVQTNSLNPFTSTANPYVGNYYNIRRQTTKNPYDFGNFGKTTQSAYNVKENDNINNNYLKRSYNDASYYLDSSNLTRTIVKGRF